MPFAGITTESRTFVGWDRVSIHLATTWNTRSARYQHYSQLKPSGKIQVNVEYHNENGAMVPSSCVHCSHLYPAWLDCHQWWDCFRYQIMHHPACYSWEILRREVHLPTPIKPFLTLLISPMMHIPSKPIKPVSSHHHLPATASLFLP